MGATKTPAEPAWLDLYGQSRHDRGGRHGTRRAVGLALVLIAAIAVIAWARSAQSSPWRSPSGAVAFTRCLYGAHAQVTAWCARLQVPRDSGLAGSPSIALHVAVVPAAQGPSDGALLYLEGGPGGAASDAIADVDATLGAISAYRDLVFVDQRGTGASQRLDCPRADVPALAAAAVARYVAACFAVLGAAPRSYGSAAAADDLEAVRRALGYGPVDLFGGSYGATLAEVYLQRYPGSVRTATLDSASLLTVPLYERWARSAQRSLDAALARCSAAPACHAAFPHLAVELGHPAPTRASAIEALTRTPEGVARLPGMLHDAAHGDASQLAVIFRQQVGAQLEPAARLAMFWEIHCNEAWARFGVAATRAAGRDSYLGPVTVARAEGFAQACAAVPSENARVEPQRPVRVPVLLLSGADDPLDPPANLAGWRTLFPDGRLVVVPGVGHGTVRYGCVALLAARFVERGTARGLDVSCARHVLLPPFDPSR